MKELLFIIILPLIALNGLDESSINFFLNYILETGYYDVFESIKKVFGSDVAIDFCKEFLQTNDCEEAINVYMSNKDKAKRAPSYTSFYIKIEENSKIKNEELISQEFDKAEVKIVDTKIGLIELLYKDENIKVLRQFYSEKDIVFKSLKIIKRKRLPLLKADIIIIERTLLLKHNLVIDNYEIKNRIYSQ